MSHQSHGLFKGSVKLIGQDNWGQHPLELSSMFIHSLVAYDLKFLSEF